MGRPMTDLFSIEELTIFGVYDAGVPNMERVVILANAATDTTPFGLMIGMRGPGGTVIPLRDNMLWFGVSTLNAGDWLFVYTGSGQPRSADIPGSQQKVYSVHWGKPVTAFNSPELVPVLFRLDGIQVPKTLPELAHSQS